MFNIFSKLFGRVQHINEGYTPPKCDTKVMKYAYKRLSAIGALEMPLGTTIKTIPGIRVSYIFGDYPTVFATSDTGKGRPVGSILPDGMLNYVEHRK